LDETGLGFYPKFTFGISGVGHSSCTTTVKIFLARTKCSHNPVAEKQRRKRLNVRLVSQWGRSLLRPVEPCFEVVAGDTDLTTVQLAREQCAGLVSQTSASCGC
jgi:hypothetical protein